MEIRKSEWQIRRLSNAVAFKTGREEIKKIMQLTKQEEKRKYAEEDIEEWLRVSLPILKGPFAGKPWIKYVLKELTRANGLAVGI